MRKHVEFYGREDLIAQLENLWAKRVASLVTCRGRRRVGKSTLIAEFARRSLWFVEIKRKHEIGRDIEMEVDRKVAAVKRPEGVSAKTALVYDGHLSPVAAADGYFDAIVPFKRLLGLE